MGFNRARVAPLFNVILSDRFVGLFGLGHEGLAALAAPVTGEPVETVTIKIDAASARFNKT